MKSKTTMNYYHTPVRRAIFKKTEKNRCWQGCDEKGTLIHWWWECKLGQLLRKTIWRFLRKLKRSTIWFSNSTSGFIPKGNEYRILKRYMHSHIYHSIIHNSQDMKATQMPVNRWADEKNAVYILNGILLSHEKDRHLPI